MSGSSHKDEQCAHEAVWTGHGLKNGFSDETVVRSADILHRGLCLKWSRQPVEEKVGGALSE